jgi:hypothetical protein
VYSTLPASGPELITDAEPWLGAELIESTVNVCPDSFAGPGVSLALTSITFAVSSAVVAVSSFATGGSLTALMVSETVATFELAVPSFAL